jgi:D-amino-acid dehydrogenase
MTDERADVVVIGAGVVGAFVARRLARAGADVVLVDPAPATGASAGNAGMLVPSFCLPMANPGVLRDAVRALTGRSPAVSLGHPLRPVSLRWLAGFAVASRPGRALRDAHHLVGLADGAADAYAEVADSEGLDVGLRRTGWLHVCRDPAVLSTQVRAAERLEGLGVRHEVLDAAGLRQCEPGLATDLAGGVLYPGDAALDPSAATRAVLTGALRAGARLRQARVTAVEKGSTGRVRAVGTSAGRLEGDAFVLAAGTASREVGRLFGVRLPIEPGYGWSITVPTSGSPGPVGSRALMAADDHVVVNPGARQVRVTGGMEIGGRPSAAPSPAAVAALRASAERLLPALAALPAGAVWRGARPMTPTGLPIIGPAGRNVVVATGHGTLGMTLAPATARAVEALLMHGTYGTSSSSRPRSGDPS